ncbi:metal-dependent hydrolase [Antarcticirhabdus aurantiaca]|uniref:Metal-dependent hydrolase n=1 Tax=Antarcticirhabdus aurantiaca TaxID=2606717 RepID=A0ACD4NX20_9HYPH|nr:metal-dependent hydrolase [Antarcticirhabdus aurantiaca]WAJ31054.1 metal-dependent hydrolase [Jeongeuplla avenae]
MRLTHFGHSAFRFETGRSVVLVDPFLQGNPHYKGSLDDAIRGTTHIALTHGHSDHVGDTIAIAEQTGAKVVGTFELVSWLAGKGVKAIEPANTGGTVAFDDFSVTLTQAFHSSAAVSENGQTTYLGMPNGLVFHFSDGPTVYDMGDTDIFGDMALINELHQPKVGLVPIGDRLTMGAAVAALACRRYFQFETVIPIHYGTMPILDQSPDKFREAMEGEAAKIRLPKVGEAIEL